MYQLPAHICTLSSMPREHEVLNEKMKKLNV
jgi:hypothetical protein